jgi:SPP1 family phage portal protein
VYPNTETETEILNKFIKDNAPTDTSIIQKLIESHDTSKMTEGVRYYENDGDIKRRTITFYKDGEKVVDETKPNNKVAHGWHKLLVDQKQAYLVGNPIVFQTEDKGLSEAIDEILGEDWDDTANELVLNASNKGREWLHPYIDEEGNFDYVIIPAEQVIPIYDESKKKKILGAIRYYMVGDVLKVEYWDSKTVIYYEKTPHSELVMDVTVENNPDSHFYYGEQGYGWEKVPFIEFKNNEKCKGDLHYYKDLIDDYDKTVSNVSNNLEEIQSLIYVLKGYEGTGLSEFMENLRYYKAIAVDGDGSGVDTIQAEMPIATVDSHLNRQEDNIYTFGQGVNVKTDAFGNSPSGIALKFLFSLLDMKSSVLERKFKKSLEQLMWFLCEYLRMAGKGDFDYKTVKFLFDKSTLLNELEQADIAMKSKGIISDKTIIANHPWVTDIQQETDEVEKEREAYAALLPPIEE